MPILSDFTVVTDNDLIFRSSSETKSYTFNTSGRHNSQAVLDVAFGASPRLEDQTMSVRLKLNGKLLTNGIARRWASGLLNVYERNNIVVKPSILNSGNNTLSVEPYWETPNDYLFVGPIVCHFHQRD